MTYQPFHPFTPHPRDESVCGAPDGGDVCAQPPDNPIHRITSPATERLDRALAEYDWSRVVGAHWSKEACRHRGVGPCGLCGGDVHAIALAVADILAVERRG